MQDYSNGLVSLKLDTIYIIGVGVKDRKDYEDRLRNAKEEGTLPVPPGYPASEVLRQRELFGDN